MPGLSLSTLVMPRPSHRWCHACGNLAAAASPPSDICSNCEHKFCDAHVQAGHRRAVCGHGEYNNLPTWWISAAVTLYVLASLMNNVGDTMMGYRIPCYPEFALYGTTAGYTLGFAFLAWITGQPFTGLERRDHVQFMWLGLWTSLNGVLAQYAIPFVQAELGVLLSQISVPTTWAVMMVMFKWKLTTTRLLCFTVIIAGILVGALPALLTGSSGGGSLVTSSPVWIVVAILAALPTALENTFQERVFKEHNCGIWVCLTYYNFYSLVAYVASLPLMTTKVFGHGSSFAGVMKNQYHSLLCFFGAYDEEPYTHEILQSDCHPDVPNCYDGARFWTIVFVLGYIGMFGIGAMILRVRDAAFEANINAAVTPLTSVIFWMKFITGGDTQNPVWFVAVSVCIITAANFAYARYAQIQPGTQPRDDKKDAVARFIEDRGWNEAVSCCRHSKNPSEVALLG